MTIGRFQPILDESARPGSTASWWITTVNFIFRSFFLSGTLQLTLIVGRVGAGVLYLGTHLLYYPEASNLRPSILGCFVPSAFFSFHALDGSFYVLACLEVPGYDNILRFYYNLTVDGLIIVILLYRWSTILSRNIDNRVDDQILLIVFQQYAFFLDKQANMFIYYICKEDEVHFLADGFRVALLFRKEVEMDNLIW